MLHSEKALFTVTSAVCRAESEKERMSWIKTSDSGGCSSPFITDTLHYLCEGHRQQAFGVNRQRGKSISRSAEFNAWVMWPSYPLRTAARTVWVISPFLTGRTWLWGTAEVSTIQKPTVLTLRPENWLKKQMEEINIAESQRTPRKPKLYIPFEMPTEIYLRLVWQISGSYLGWARSWYRACLLSSRLVIATRKHLITSHACRL